MSPTLAAQIREHIPLHLQEHPELQQFFSAIDTTYNKHEHTAKTNDNNREEPKYTLGKTAQEAQVNLSLKRAVDSLNVNLGVADKLEHNSNFIIDTEKLARHVSKLASQIAQVTREKNGLLKELEAQNESLNNYVQMVSHDLKSPLRNVNALMAWILEEEKSNFSEHSQRNCTLVSENLLRMDNLISGILQHATVGKHMEARSDVDISMVVLEAADKLCIPTYIALEIADDLPVISTQKYWVEQVFSNLLANAIAATRHNKKGVIGVSIIADDTYWKFTITDNGKGIPEKHMSNIFAMFQKLENGSNTAGVGLSLVKKITHLFQGDVWLRSEVGKGTTFYVTFKKNYDG